ncbi:MAG: hypothetical protein AB2A00_11125, partial [Myxococcota bacterium]
MTSISGARFASTGLQASTMFERLGLPGSISSALGAQIDEALGDIPGMFQNLTDMFTRGIQEDLGRLFGTALPPANAVPRPTEFLADALERGVGRFSALGGVARAAPFGTGALGRSLEAAVKTDPLFKSALEGALGGVIVPDGRNDGKLTVYRPSTTNIGDALKDVLQKGLLAATGLAGAVAGIGVPFGAGGPLQSALARLAGNLADFAVNGPNANQGAAGASSAGGAGGAGDAGGSWSAAVGPEGEEFAKGMGIDLAHASFEDVLFLLLMKYAKKKEDDIMKKVQELDKSMQSGEGGGAGGAGGAGSGGGAGGAGSGGGVGGAGSGGGVGGAGCTGPAGCV